MYSSHTLNLPRLLLHGGRSQPFHTLPVARKILTLSSSNQLSSHHSQHHSQQPTFTHLAEPAYPGATLGVALIIMCQKITTTYKCGHTAVTWVKTSGCSGEVEKCPHIREISFTNSDYCDKYNHCEKPKSKLR